jgi:sodium/hydrogen antiporter
VLLGPHCTQVIDPRSWGDKELDITLEVTRVVLAVGCVVSVYATHVSLLTCLSSLFAIGVELPRSYIARHAKGLAILVIPTMAFGWMIVSGASRAPHIRIIPKLKYSPGMLKLLFPNLSFVSCLAIAACLTPTDPIICAAVIGTLLPSDPFERWGELTGSRG